MKKIIPVVIIFVIATFFVIGNKLDKKQELLAMNDETDSKRAVFLSYIELGEYIKNQDIKTSKQNIINIINNLSNNNFNMLILHVRPFSDAIYNSFIYPSSRYVVKNEGDNLPFDILSFFISEAHKKNIEVHAWINPYRIRNTTSEEDISKDSPYFKFKGTNNVKIIKDKGIYYNPASSEVEDLIIDGIKEIITNYQVDGIHFDDYFYPDNTIDLESYEEYIENGGYLTLSDYRLNNVSKLIKRVYDTIKDVNPNIVFGISPEGNINNNYNNNYVDTKKYLSNSGYLDYIMPQIYFGFENEVMPFIDTLNMWNSLITFDNIKIIPALALYKSGKEDMYARSGKMEWINHDDIISREILISRTVSHYNGFCLFRYDNLFNDDYLNNNLKKERENLFSLIK